MTISNTPTELDITQDTDAAETQEWLEALDCVLRSGGPRRCEELLRKIQEHARSLGIEVRSLLNTPYCNTIPHSSQPVYPGDLDLERRITSIIRWNALAMVVRANRHGSEMGGHLASYASAVDLF
jgi:pyruvate dehydrogenase E1 component